MRLGEFVYTTYGNHYFVCSVFVSASSVSTLGASSRFGHGFCRRGRHARTGLVWRHRPACEAAAVCWRWVLSSTSVSGRAFVRAAAPHPFGPVSAGAAECLPKAASSRHRCVAVLRRRRQTPAGQPPVSANGAAARSHRQRSHTMVVIRGTTVRHAPNPYPTIPKTQPTSRASAGALSSPRIRPPGISVNDLLRAERGHENAVAPTFVGSGSLAMIDRKEFNIISG
jgi:hypothetical protein